MIKNISKFTLDDWRFLLFLSLLVGAPLSKYPSFGLPVLNFPSFRIGLYQILAVAFVILCLKPIYKSGLTFFTKNHKTAFISLLILSILTLGSVLWSLYPARSLLLALSVIILLFVAISGWWFSANNLTQKRKNIMLNALLYSAIFFGAVATLQLIIFTLTNQTLGILCSGCTAKVFGFPRVNGLTAEPQFFANAILPFVFASLYSVIKEPSKLAWVALVASVGTIGLTFSRGAYIALAISLIAVGINLYTKKFASAQLIIRSYLVIALSIFGSLLLLILSATIRYSTTPNIAYETTDSIFEHLTLGVIDLPESSTPLQQPTEPANNQVNKEPGFVSPGLVEESGQERLSAADLALKAWRYSPFTVLFGVGIGNLGPFVVANIDPTAPNNLTVYIYYILILAELGIIGLIVLLIVFGSAIRSLAKYNILEATMINGLLVAFFVQFLFFGSHINVVYVWLWLGIALGITSIKKPIKKL